MKNFIINQICGGFGYHAESDREKELERGILRSRLADALGVLLGAQPSKGAFNWAGSSADGFVSLGVNDYEFTGYLETFSLVIPEAFRVALGGVYALNVRLDFVPELSGADAVFSITRTVTRETATGRTTFKKLPPIVNRLGVENYVRITPQLNIEVIQINHNEKAGGSENV